MSKNRDYSRKIQPRVFQDAKTRDRQLGPLKLLPGTWKSEGKGWNMIALPFFGGKKPNPLKYRVLMNQYDEVLKFSLVDKNVPNRGLPPRTKSTPKSPTSPDQFDQKLVTIDYEQTIKQVAADDFPKSTLEGGPGLPIHHEPGLWLYMKNKNTDNSDTGRPLNIARLATIPHGNSLLALGSDLNQKGMPPIPPLSGLPFGVPQDIDQSIDDFLKNPYLAPYKHYIDNPFMGTVPSTVPGFPGFTPKNMNAILEFANQGLDIVETTILSVDTTVEEGAVVNIPFAVKEAEPASMKSTFWIQELKEKGPDKKPKLRMQYSQVVMLDFFSPRRDGMPGRISWPHISINTLEKEYVKGRDY